MPETSNIDLSELQDPKLMEFWETQLQEARFKIGKNPRTFPPEVQAKLVRRTYYTIVDSLGAVLKRRDEILRDGVVVWGCLIKADEELLKPDSRDMPADIIFCPSSDFNVAPTDLLNTAAYLKSKAWQKTGNPLEDAVLDHLQRRTSRAMGMKVPGFKYELMLSTILMERKNLPGRAVSAPVFPVLVLRDGAAMLLPAMFWPEELQKLCLETVNKKHPPLSPFAIAAILIIACVGLYFLLRS